MEHQQSICPRCTYGHSVYIVRFEPQTLQIVGLLYSSSQMWRYTSSGTTTQQSMEQQRFQLSGTNSISSASQKMSFLTCLVCDNWLIIGCIATWTTIRSPKTRTKIEVSGKKWYLPNYCLIINFHDAVWITASSSESEMNNNVIAYWQKLWARY